MTIKQNLLWQQYNALADEIATLLPRIHEIPTATWNSLADKLTATAKSIRQDPALLVELRHAAAEIQDSEQLTRAYDVLTGAVFDGAGKIQDIVKDDRLADVINYLTVEPALYVSETATEEDPYSADETEDEWRDLTRIAGAPTTTPGFNDPGIIFLLQIDLAAVSRESTHSPELAELLQSHPLPVDGLLQFFHTTLGDTRTDAGHPTGGVLVRHVPEREVRQRTAPTTRDTMYPTYVGGITVLPTFRARSTASPKILERAMELQEESDRVARNGSYTDDYLTHHSLNPFTARAGRVTHLFGTPSPESEFGIHDHLTLAQNLPLKGPSDQHLLLCEVPGATNFDSIFGENGRLEVWIRRSDLLAQRFTEVVSFIRTT